MSYANISFKNAVTGGEVGTVTAPVDTWAKIPVYMSEAAGQLGPEFVAMLQDEQVVMLARSTVEGKVSLFTGTYNDAIDVGWQPQATWQPHAPMGGTGGVTARASVLRADGTYEE